MSNVFSRAKSKGQRVEQTPAELSPQSPAPNPQKVPWGAWAAVVYATVVYFAAQFFASLFIIIYPHLHHWNKAVAQNWLDTSVYAQFWYVLAAEVLTFGAIWWFVRRRKGSLRTIGWRRLRFTDVAYALAGFALYFIGYVIVLSVVSHLVPSLNVNQKQELGFQDTSGDINLLLTFLSLVVLPPLVEETVFRGFVFSGLKNKLPVMYAAILTSVLFASAHLQFGSGKPLLWVAAIDTFTLSLVLCYLRQKTDGLWAGVFLHAMKNGIAFVSLFLLHVR
jgi:membrane protease YdiL (CAAX protease family)